MKIAVLFSIIVCSFTAAYAQSPVQIDVKSLTISKTGHNTDAIVTMSATGLPAPFSSPLTGYGEALWRTLEVVCFPCGTGTTVHMNWISNGSGNFVNGFYPNGSAGNTQVRFTASGSAPDIALSPRLSRKKSPLIFSGDSVIKGRIELLNNGIVVGVDDDVALSGTVKTTINNFLIWNSQSQSYQRGFSYNNLLFSYSQ